MKKVWEVRNAYYLGNVEQGNHGKHSRRLKGNILNGS
jgi:hypothetical protein